ncbi:MAG TPA: hypothetical protein VMJ32_09475 [Pirellulales bacterium]|nr:hypothetical protein [Pirellulales bacterium]
MSIASLGFAGIGAATPLPQSKGADTDRTSQEMTVQRIQQQTDLQAEQAAGIGQTDGDEHETEERDADGRRPWELPEKKKNPPDAAIGLSDSPLPSSRDPSGQCGNMLDLTG